MTSSLWRVHPANKETFLAFASVSQLETTCSFERQCVVAGVCAETRAFTKIRLEACDIDGSYRDNSLLCLNISTHALLFILIKKISI